MRLVIGVIALSMLAAGCESPAPGPGGVPRPPEPPPGNMTGSRPAGAPSVLGLALKPAITTQTHSGSAAATVTMSKTYLFEAVYQEDNGNVRYVYTPNYLLTETSGRSAVTFSTMQVAPPSGQPVESCFDARLAAGGTLDPFSQEADSECYLNDYTPNLHLPDPLSSLTVTLTFVDDQGAPGTLVVRFSTN